MSSLIERIRRARETVVEASGFEFTVRRPTDLEMLELQGSNPKQGDLLTRFVIGWGKVKELDIVPGGTDAPVPFEAALFAEWIADRPDLWNPITESIVTSYRAHKERLAESAKK